jgi:hypothetical protein
MLPKRIIILDTETISLTKPYIYDLGFIVAELDESINQYKPIAQSQQIIEQIYDNLALFTTAYYENKRLTYTNLMKGKTAKKIKYGFALRHLQNMIKQYDVQMLCAYNSPFDKKALKFTSDFFKYANDFQNIAWLDIHAVANEYLHKHETYINFALENEWFNASGYLQTNAQNTYGFLLNEPTYQEPHTSLQDCIIEMDILNVCIDKGFDNSEPIQKSFITTNKLQVMNVKTAEKTYSFKYSKRVNHKNGDITLKK